MREFKVTTSKFIRKVLKMFGYKDFFIGTVKKDIDEVYAKMAGKTLYIMDKGISKDLIKEYVYCQTIENIQNYSDELNKYYNDWIWLY